MRGPRGRRTLGRRAARARGRRAARAHGRHARGARQARGAQPAGRPGRGLGVQANGLCTWCTQPVLTLFDSVFFLSH